MDGACCALPPATLRELTQRVAYCWPERGLVHGVCASCGALVSTEIRDSDRVAAEIAVAISALGNVAIPQALIFCDAVSYAALWRIGKHSTVAGESRATLKINGVTAVARQPQ